MWRRDAVSEFALITWLCNRVMRFQSRPINWPLLTIESPVAQWLEHPTRSQRVVGSNPIWGLDFFQVLQNLIYHLFLISTLIFSTTNPIKSETLGLQHILNNTRQNLNMVPRETSSNTKTLSVVHCFIAEFYSLLLLSALAKMPSVFFLDEFSC